MTTLVVFDLFGTLVRGAPAAASRAIVTRAAVECFGIEERLASALGRDVGQRLTVELSRRSAQQRPTVDVVQVVARRHGLSLSPEDVERWLWAVYGPAGAGYEVVTGAVEALTVLRSAGCTLRVLSGCVPNGAVMTRILAHLSLATFFDRCLYSSDGGPRKPHAAAFERIGAGSFDRRVMAGDDPDLDLLPAASLGWLPVRVDPAAHDFGPVLTAALAATGET
jgi:FMN phosphatase YigB (HAD superfamily)